MAALTIQVPDECAEAFRTAEIATERTLEADWITLRGVVAWTIENAAGELIDHAQAADGIPADRARELASRIEALSWVYEQMEANSDG